MNTELQGIIRQAEGRYLNEQELDAFLTYTQGLPARLAKARTLQEQETKIVETAATATLEQFNELVDVPHAREKMARDFRIHLRYIAQAHVHDDMAWFEEQYAEWNAELICGMVDAEVLVKGYDALLQSMKETLDPVDYRSYEPFTRRFMALLEEQA